MVKRTPTSAPTSTPPSPHTAARATYLWLATAAVLFLFVSGQWTIPLAAWLAPLFLLRFVRIQRPLPGFLLAWLVRAATGAVVLRDIILVSGIPYYAIVLFSTLIATLPYLADRLLAPRFSGFVATLIFPLAFTTIEYLSSFGPTGTYTSLAYTQYGDLPLMQLVSVTGIWGITFLITWFAAVVNWAWERDFSWPNLRRGGALYAAILLLVLLGGGARLALVPPQAGAVRVAGISASRSAVAAFDKQLPSATLNLLISGQATPADRAAARSALAILDDDLFARTQQEAAAGAKIVLWPEASSVGANILQEDEPALIQRASALARQADIYLEMGLGVLLPAGSPPPVLKDEAILLDPSGNVVWTYEKFHLVPFGENGVVVRGDGKLPTVATPYGRLVTAICFDADYPTTMRQAGQDGADLLLVPGDDWQAIAPYHTQMAVFRAIENGSSLVRQASNGLSIAVDYEGHVLAASNYFTTGQQVLIAYVPVYGVRTIYAAIGDLFAWLCLLGLLFFIGLVTLRTVRTRKGQPVALTAAPVPEPQTVR